MRYHDFFHLIAFQKIEDKCQVCYLDPIHDPDLISKELESLDTVRAQL